MTLSPSGPGSVSLFLLERLSFRGFELRVVVLGRGGLERDDTGAADSPQTG